MSATGSLPYPSPGAEWPSLGAWPSPSPEAITVVPGVRWLRLRGLRGVAPLRRSSSLKDAPEFTAALAAWRHSFSETPTVGVADASGAPTDDVFRV